MQVKIHQLEAKRGQRVKVFGWIHRLRRQGEEPRALEATLGVLLISCLKKKKHKLICLVLVFLVSTGKSLMFIVLRDGTGFLQCVLSDKLVLLSKHTECSQ